jgi:hypothetical protein
VASDTLGGSFKLALMEVNHVKFGGDGAATIYIPRSKSDVADDLASLSPETAAVFSRWLTPLGFEALRLSGVLSTTSFRQIVNAR